MAIMSHPQTGIMDLDSPVTKVRPGFNIGARNIIWRGTQGNRRAESNLGTNLIPNTFLPGSGTNVTIGVHYDANKQRLFFFNYNSAGNHGIYIYYTTVGTFVRLIQTGVNTSGDPLAFLPYPRISSIDILYGDGQSGDLLFFVDSLLRPRKLNINRLLNGGYSNTSDNFLKVIKAPPTLAPQVTYENDYTVSANNLLNALWQFAYTWIYDDNEESVVSTASIVPLPPNPFNPTKNVAPSQGARIALYLQTGDQNVAKIRIYGRQTTNGGSGGWQIVDTLIKSQMGIGNNTMYRYLFYGNGNYPAADPSFAALLFDLVPQQANAECLLNGNVVAYGGITEGYNYFNPVLSVSTTNVSVPAYTVNSSLFFAAPNGQTNQLTCYLTGVGDNDSFGNPVDLFYPPQVFYVRAKSNGSDISFNYTNTVLLSIPLLIAQLEAAAVAAGWTVVSTGTNSFTISYPTGTVVFQSSFTTGLATTTFGYNLDNFAHLPQASYQYGVVYFDADGRTNGVITNLQGQVVTPASPGNSTQFAQVTLNVSGYTPPAWAVYWRPVRTDNLSYNKFLQWITDAAYSNSLSNATQQFAYFGLNNIAYYNSTFSTSANVVSYQFSPGDRLKITGRYAIDGSFTPLNLDYAIINTVSNPNVNGAIKTGGLFLQIAYPAADINSNFKLDGADDFQNYQITIYSAKAQNPSGTNVFFEVGQTYGIGNPGLGSAYHIGNVADNQVSITDGDVFYRTRNVPLVNAYTLTTGSFNQGSPYGTLWILPGTEATPIANNSLYEIRGDFNKVAGLTNTTYPTWGDGNQTFWNKSGFTLNVRLQFTINVTDTTDPNGQFQGYIKMLDPSNNVTLFTTVSLQTGLVVHTQNTYQVDVTIPVPANNRFWFVNFCQNQMFISPSPIQLTVIRNRPVNVFDYSFTDAFNIRSNADNRPTVQDTSALQTYFTTLFRYSQQYELGTNINNTNRFYAANFDEFTKDYGDIRRLIVWQKRVRVAQSRKWGEIGIFAKFIKNNTGETTLVVSDTIITQNNIEYFQGDYGVGNQPDCIGQNGFQLWFVDPVRGLICRLSQDGVKPISAEAMIQTFAGSALTPYLNKYNYPFGGQSSVLGAYHFVKDRDPEVLFAFQPGTAAPGVIGPSTLPGQTLSWNEEKNGFQSFYDFGPDAIVSCENTLYSFSNGVLYSHTNTSAYCNYYGNQFQPQLTYVFNDFGIQKKFWTAISQVANVPWNAPLIYTETETYPGQRQQSKLVDANFFLLEGIQHATFLRDINSRAGWVNGDFLKGTYIVAQLQPTDGSKFVFLSDIYLRWEDSQLTTK